MDAAMIHPAQKLWFTGTYLTIHHHWPGLIKSKTNSFIIHHQSLLEFMYLLMFQFHLINKFRLNPLFPWNWGRIWTNQRKSLIKNEYSSVRVTCPDTYSTFGPDPASGHSVSVLGGLIQRPANFRFLRSLGGNLDIWRSISAKIDLTSREGYIWAFRGPNTMLYSAM